LSEFTSKPLTLSINKTLLSFLKDEEPSTPNSDLIDHETFDQLLEMDDDEDHDFSKSIVWNYFEQAETTFGSMDKAL
jgi:osomolarity two-component system phosphorelay intermediate protein YPD1